MNIILLGCVLVLVLAASAASCPVCCARTRTSCQSKGQESANSASKGQDSGDYGSKGQDSGDYGKKGNDSGNKGQGSDDSGSKGSSAGSSGGAAAGVEPRVEQVAISSGDTTITKTVASAERGAVAAAGASGSTN